MNWVNFKNEVKGGTNYNYTVKRIKINVNEQYINGWQNEGWEHSVNEIKRGDLCPMTTKMKVWIRQTKLSD